MIFPSSLNVVVISGVARSGMTDGILRVMDTVYGILKTSSTPHRPLGVTELGFSMCNDL